MVQYIGEDTHYLELAKISTTVINMPPPATEHINWEFHPFYLYLGSNLLLSAAICFLVGHRYQLIPYAFVLTELLCFGCA